MKTWKIPMITSIAIGAILLLGFTYTNLETKKVKALPFIPPKGCVFRTVFGEEVSNINEAFKTPEKVSRSMDRGLVWITTAQNQDGGWGAGSHSRQHVKNLRDVPSDPATTSMVAMALLRSGTALKSGAYKKSLNDALEYLLKSVETSPAQSNTITTETGTQIQTKLGQNIDVILTAQFLSNISDYSVDDAHLRNRIKKSLQVCVHKIQNNQEEDGSIGGAGWAGVLQSAFANNALESAQAIGVDVDDSVLEKSRRYQTNNYDAKTGESKTDKGAGVILYSVSGSVRANAKEARKVKEEIESAKNKGSLPASAPVSAQSLKEIGYSAEEAMRYATAYEVYESAKVQSQRGYVMDGFGSNGGEEFLSYLQTGESLIINKDNTWQEWYNTISGRMLSIQNNDGSWSGHHCITSPVFCTATSLLILSINNDVDQPIKLGNN